MSDNEVPIHKWWPNYPNPVQMHLCWERDDNYRLVYGESDIHKFYSATGIEDNNSPSSGGVEVVRRPPPSYSVAIRQKSSVGNFIDFSNTESPTNSTKLEVKKIQSQIDVIHYSNEKKDFQSHDKEIENMRPYKKRSFHSHLQSNESNMENENSEDSEKQVSGSPPIADGDKDKDKEGEIKRRKRWKRKISRKQFRHHDIQLFTPGEYKSTSFLKQKDTTSTIPKKSEVASKEAITDLIVTTLGGQKQGASQKKTEEVADSTTKNDTEENNNSNGIQNNNNIGKHNLPAIIIETPSVRRRSIDNTNIPKSNFKSLENKFNRRMSVDMPVLHLTEQISESLGIQPQIADVRQEPIVRNNESKPAADGPRNIKKVSNNASDMEDKRYFAKHIPEAAMQNLNLNQNQLAVNHLTMEQTYLGQNSKYNGQMEDNDSIRRLGTSNLEPMETSIDEQPMEPENLSLKRRLSVEIPVDLSKKNVESVDHRQESHLNDDLKRMNAETHRTVQRSYEPLNYHQDPPPRASSQTRTEEYVKNNATNHKSISPNVRQGDSHDQDHTIRHAILADTVAKITNLNMWQEVLQRLLKQPFTLHILDLMAHAYKEIELATEEGCVPPELKLKAQKLLSETFSFISAKLKQLNLDVNPVYVIKILGQSENSSEKNTLRHYMENIERIRKLSIDEAVASSIPQTPTSHFPPPSNPLHSYRELPRSPPSPYATSQYYRSSRDSHLPSEPLSLPSDHSSPLRHHGGPSPRVGGHHISPGYLRESSPKTGNHPISGGYSRETSPKTADHPMSTEQLPRTRDYSSPHRRSRGPSPQTSDHLMPSGLPPRPTDYPYTQEHPRGQIPQIGDHLTTFGHPRIPPPRIGEYSMAQGNSREPSPRAADHHRSPVHPSEAFLRAGRDLMQHGLSRRPSPRSNHHSTALEHTNESSLRTNKHYRAGGFTERSPISSSDHTATLGYPRDIRLQHQGSYNMSYLPNTVNLNSFLAQPKEPSSRTASAVGRPRSKSHRHADIQAGHHHLRRSLSNPQHPPMENPLLPPPFLEGAASRMPPPRVPTTAAHNFHPLLQPNNILPPPAVRPNNLLPAHLVHNQELSITSSKADNLNQPAKSEVPSLYSEVFYQNLHNHVAKGNPLAISVHPHPRMYQKKATNTLPNVHSMEISDNQKGTSNVREVHQKAHEEHHLSNELPAALVTSQTEAKITSSTDHLEISKVTNTPKQQGYDKASLADPASSKPTETIKSIPVAVIVADNSMQITKETTATASEARRKQGSSELREESTARVSVSSNNSNENISSSEENLRRAFDQEQEENNTEFLVWLEKLKSNEKLKSRFLSQMGIIKKEEPPFVSGSDPIEIVDSDEEDSVEPQTDERNAQQSTEKSLDSRSNRTQNSLEESKTQAHRPNYSETSIPQEIPAQQTASATPAPSALEVNKEPSAPNLSERIRNSSSKESLSKKDYIPPIALPYVPLSKGQNLGYTPTPTRDNKKAIYSPEIEPISPVTNEPSFVFPDVEVRKKLVPPLNINPNDRDSGYPESMTSPSYNKRKTPLDFPGYQSDESIGTPTDYPNDSAIKRRKSLDRPDVTRSPRIAPSGKLCYVRESHMFLRYFDDTQVELFIRNLSTQDEELLRSTGIEPEKFKSSHQSSKFSPDQLAKTEIIYLPRDVEFSEKEDIPEVEEFIKETSLVEQFVPKDFADFYRYVTGFQIIKNKHPVSLQTFLTMYNTNRTSELLRKYLERDEVVSRTR